MKQLYPSCRIVLLLDADPLDEIEAVLECGADSIIRRESSCAVLHDTLRLVFDGVTVMPSAVVDVLRAARNPGPRQARGRRAGHLDRDAVQSNGSPRRNHVKLGGRGTHLVMPEQPAALPNPMVTIATSPSVIHASQAQTRGLSARELNVLEGLKEGLPNKQIARQLEITEATVKVHVKSILRKTGVRNRTQVAMWATRQKLDCTSGLSPALQAPPGAFIPPGTEHALHV